MCSMIFCISFSRWEPSTKRCSSCGHVKDLMPLSEQVYRCKKCGLKSDRDLNAARNLAAMAGSSPVSACGLDSADTSEWEAGRKHRTRPTRPRLGQLWRGLNRFFRADISTTSPASLD